jgi:hypothetical protein
MFFAVIAMVRLVRPWYAWSKTATAVRAVAARAILTAFSTASAPLLNNADLFACVPGVRAPSSAQTSTYPSYGVIMKQVWVNARTCSTTRPVTSGAALPTLVTAMPEARSISELPSASRSTPPPAASTKTGRVVATPAATCCRRRSNLASETGPGTSVTSRRS